MAAPDVEGDLEAAYRAHHSSLHLAVLQQCGLAAELHATHFNILHGGILIREPREHVKSGENLMKGGQLCGERSKRS